MDRQPSARQSTSTSGFSTSSAAMRDTLATVERFAPLSWPVLILGESGCGKEWVARTLHDLSPRRGGPFVAVNAGAIAPTLAESAFFGHERGAFTGATDAHRGYFEQAEGGTLFLDEVGELPDALQTRLLRVLEQWVIRPLGSQRCRDLDVRLVCATHRNLLGPAKADSFRQDLYYRLARLVVRVPPLRERLVDLPPIAGDILAQAEPEVGPCQLTPDATDVLTQHDWPGNIRELRNVLHCAAALSQDGVVDGPAVLSAITQLRGATGHPTQSTESLRALLARHGGNLSATARSLGIPRTTLRDRLRGVKSRPRLAHPAW